MPRLQQSIRNARLALREDPPARGARGWPSTWAGLVEPGVPSAAVRLLDYLGRLPGGALQTYMALERSHAVVVPSSNPEGVLALEVSKLDQLGTLETRLWQEIRDAFGATIESGVRDSGCLSWLMPLGREHVRLELTEFDSRLGLIWIELESSKSTSMFGAERRSNPLLARVHAIYLKELAKRKN